MDELKPVSRPPFLLDGRGSRVVVLVGLAVLVALLKPWGSPGTGGPQSDVASVPTPELTRSPSPAPSLDLRDAYSRRYDPLIFGDHELQPGWGLWPTGYMVSFGFVMHVEPSGQPTGGPSPSHTGPPDPGAPTWPTAIEIPYGNHLLLIGVDTPEGYSVAEVHLTRHLADGGSETVPIVRPPSPWPSHFTVVGLDGGYGVERTALWGPGRYRLDLVIGPGTVVHSIEVLVDGDPLPIPSGPPPAEAP
jgi:hypothetical protein